MRRGERREEPVREPEPESFDVEPRPARREPERFAAEPMPRRWEPEPPRERRFPAELERRPAREPGLVYRAERRPTRFVSLLARAGAGLAAGGLVLAALGLPEASSPVAPVPAAGVVGVSVALLPRVAWLLAALAAVLWLGLGAGLDGAAVLVLLAVAPTPLLLARAGWAWSVPALAPLLGTIALGPAYVAVSGLASTPIRRAALAAAGYLWLAGAEALTGDSLVYGAPAAVPAPGEWESSLPSALSDAVPPFLSTPALVPALAWGLFAALLPLAVRGRSPKLDLVRGSIWAGGLVAALLGLGDLLASGGAGLDARGTVVGPFVGLVFAVAAAGVRAGAREAPRRRGDRPPADAMDRPVVA